MTFLFSFRLSLASLGFEMRHVGPVMTMEFSPDGGKRLGSRCDLLCVRFLLLELTATSPVLFCHRVIVSRPWLQFFECLGYLTMVSSNDHFPSRSYDS